MLVTCHVHAHMYTRTFICLSFGHCCLAFACPEAMANSRGVAALSLTQMSQYLEKLRCRCLCHCHCCVHTSRCICPHQKPNQTRINALLSLLFAAFCCLPRHCCTNHTHKPLFHCHCHCHCRCCCPLSVHVCCSLFVVCKRRRQANNARI